MSEALAQPAPGAGGGGGGGGGGGAQAALRERLVSELRLSVEQQAKLDAINMELRPQFMALRELAEEQRRAARDKVMAEMRSKISAMLTPEQRLQYQAMAAETAARTSSRGRIYLLDLKGKPKAVNVRLGITDGSSTELLVPAGSTPDTALANELKEGATVIIGTQGSAASSAAAQRPGGSGPRLPF